MRRLAAAFAAILGMTSQAPAAEIDLTRADGTIRFATLNTALSRRGAGLMLADIDARHPQVLAVAEIILRVRPDVILLNEFDHDPAHRALIAFSALLAEGVGGVEGIDYPHRYHGPSNTGEPTGIDLDGDGRTMGPTDAHGFGLHPGHYGMALLSRLPIDFDGVRSYRLFRWADMPGASRPMNPDGTPYHADDVWRGLRLSSKSHWIVPLILPGGGHLTVVAAHPTPPVFDGPENRNGLRNRDEIRLIAAMIDGAPWLVDDRGTPGGLAPGARFIVLGDLNADPEAGEGEPGGIGALLAHPRVRDAAPSAPGGAVHTADFGEDPGRLRVDYVLPSEDLEVAGSGVFWPAADDPLAWVVEGETSSDHRLVWVDLLP